MSNLPARTRSRRSNQTTTSSVLWGHLSGQCEWTERGHLRILQLTGFPQLGLVHIFLRNGKQKPGGLFLSGWKRTAPSDFISSSDLFLKRLILLALAPPFVRLGFVAFAFAFDWCCQTLCIVNCTRRCQACAVSLPRRLRLQLHNCFLQEREIPAKNGEFR